MSYRLRRRMFAVIRAFALIALVSLIQLTVNGASEVPRFALIDPLTDVFVPVESPRSGLHASREDRNGDSSTASLTLAQSDPMFAPLTGTFNIPGDYATLAAAIADLNTQGVGGPVILNVLAGNPQTSPSAAGTTGGGYIIGGTGSLILAGGTATSSTNTVTIRGNGNTVTAPATHAAGRLNDSIFKIIGADFITINGFTMLENPSNTITDSATNNMTEWGVALLYVTPTDGAQNNTISNNTIDLSRIYQNTFGIYSNSTHTATSVTTSATATGAGGGNSGLKVFSNTITDVNNGIVVIGPTAASDHNDGIELGGTALTANTISNYGTTSSFSGYTNVSGSVNGILVRNSKNFTVSFNTIASSNGGVTSGILNGIQIPNFSNAPTGTFINSINNNTLSLRSGLASGSINGVNISSPTASPTSTINVNNNDFNTFGHTVSGTAAIIFIQQFGTHRIQNITGNTFTNMTVNTTGSVTFILNNNTLPANGVKNVNNNSIVTSFSKTGAGGTVTGVSDDGSDPAGAINNTNSNNFSNITFVGSTGFLGISNLNGAAGAPTKTVSNNTVSNIAGGTSIITGIRINNDNGTTTASGNIVSGISAPTNVFGITLGTAFNIPFSGTGSGTTTLAQNTVHTLASTGDFFAVGIVSGGGNRQITRNKIYNIEGGTTNGIRVAGGAVNLENNLIGDLRAPRTASSFDLSGIEITGGTIVNVDFNTVRLAAANTGVGVNNFGSSAITVSSIPMVTLRNNVLINLSTARGTGTSSAYRRSDAVNLSTYGSASNNNLFFAGTPSASNLIFTDESFSSDQTLAQYKARVSPRDSVSVTENPPFLSTNGADPTFLHINPAVSTQIESGGIPVAVITVDFDGDTRNASTPDIGADEGSFTLAAFPTATPTLTPTPTPSSSPTSTPTPAATATPTPTPTPSGSISGTVTYGTTAAGQPSKFIPGVFLTAVGSVELNASTDAAGAYLLSGFGSGPYSVTPSKSTDVNGISGLDAARVAQHVAGLITLTPNQQLAGDATNNGTLSGLDAARIAQTAAGITNSGIAGQWKFVPASKNYASVTSSLLNENYEAILVGDVTGNWAPTAPRGAILGGEQASLESNLLFSDGQGMTRMGLASSDSVRVDLPSTVRIRVGRSLKLPVLIGDATGKGVVAYAFTLEYDPNLLMPGMDAGNTVGTLSDGWSVTVNSGTPGKLMVVAFGTSELAGSGTLLNLDFNVVGSKQSYPQLKWVLFQLNEGEVPVEQSGEKLPFRESRETR